MRFAAVAVVVAGMLSGCDNSASTDFAVTNHCDFPIVVGISGDAMPEGTIAVIGLNPSQDKHYVVPRETISHAITLSSSPESGDPIWSRTVAIPGDTEGGVGTRRDPYVVVVDGELCGE